MKNPGEHYGAIIIGSEGPRDCEIEILGVIRQLRFTDCDLCGVEVVTGIYRGEVHSIPEDQLFDVERLIFSIEENRMNSIIGRLETLGAKS